MNGDEFELNATNVRRCKGKDHNVLYALVSTVRTGHEASFAHPGVRSYATDALTFEAALQLVTSVHAKCDAQEQLQVVEKQLQEAMHETEVSHLSVV